MEECITVRKSKCQSTGKDKAETLFYWQLKAAVEIALLILNRVFSFEVEAKNMCSKGFCLALSVVHEARLLAALFLGRCLFLFLSRSLSSLRERVEQKKQWLMN